VSKGENDSFLGVARFESGGGRGIVCVLRCCGVAEVAIGWPRRAPHAVRVRRLADSSPSCHTPIIHARVVWEFHWVYGSVLASLREVSCSVLTTGGHPLRRPSPLLGLGPHHRNSSTGSRGRGSVWSDRSPSHCLLGCRRHPLHNTTETDRRSICSQSMYRPYVYTPCL
jgi:hypothetical protein